MRFNSYSFKELLSNIVDNRGKTCPVGETGIPLIATNCIKEYSLYPVFEKVRYVSDETYSSWFRGHPEPGDMIFVCKGSPGRVNWVPDPVNFCIAQDMVAIRADTTKVYPKYLFALLRSQASQQKILNMHVGTLIPHFKKGDFGNLYFDIPEDMEYQKKVGDAYFDFCLMIESNTQTNQTLEEMAQAIFKSWFVDFDPVKAKMNGEQPEGMDEATASLFPDKLDSETGIPDGWTQGSIADIAKLNAKSWTKKNSPEQVHYVDLANTKNGVIESVTTYDFEESPSRARRILNSGDTIVGTVRPGNRSYAFIGDTEKPLTGSTGFAVLSPKKSYWTSFVYLATTNDDSIDEYARLADGGAYPAIKPTVVADTQCAIPTEDIAKKFWELTGPMLRKAHQNRLQNEDLAALRDTLLPKLLSGEIELGQTEEMAEVS
ncbi:restriction endonuclease subunit S [Shewanella mangrovisoli]|uniref:restriction endonuclease subunit S n=1 Tax=Shewanella mangrovisoli TaxID=2864211 RepID=UPI00313E9908